MKLFIVVNVDWFFLSHRLPIAVAAKMQGYDVTIVSKDTGRREEIEKYGLKFIDMPFSRSGTNVRTELATIYKLFRLYKSHKPHLLHHVTLKIAIYGSIAAKLASIKRIVNAISGLGYNFTDNRSGFIQRILNKLMKIAFGNGRTHFIFQNQDDITVFKNLNLVSDNQISLIKGSGVDLNIYTQKPAPHETPIIVLFAARMLVDKGVMEFIDAARELKASFQDKARFILAGDVDHENLASLKKEDIEKVIDGQYITWIGFQKNMINILENAAIVVLPSYREGLPKSLIEAAAVGRPIVTTNVPGCKECVIDGFNGFLVPLKSTVQLSLAIRKLINDDNLRQTMGFNSRSLAEKEFSVQSVVDKTLGIYKTFDI